MEIKITIDAKVENLLLAQNNYKVETILVSYLKYPFIEGCNLGKYYVDVAYERNKRPSCLNNDIIIVDDVKDILKDEVVSRLFKERLLSKLDLLT